MDIRKAILKAADHIESHPEDFAFMAIKVPEHCGSPGCALGWIGHFASVYGRYDEVCSKLLGIRCTFFYRIMDGLLGGDDWVDTTPDGRDGDPELTAKGLRLYADKYHPAEPEQYPSAETA